VEGGALGIVTRQGDFTNGLRFVRQARAVIDETYTLPVGKRSTYLGRANELTLTFSKDGHEVGVILRAYDDGIAFRYVLSGRGDIEIASESTTFPFRAT
jgi:alpha-glucosidase